MSYLEEGPEAKFEEFIEEYSVNKTHPYRRRVSSMLVEGKTSLIVNYNDLYYHNLGLAVDLLNNPGFLLEKFQAAVRLKMRPSLSALSPEALESYEKRGMPVNIRIKNVPNLVPLRHLAAEHIGRMITVTGIVVSTTVPHPRLTAAVFTCMNCGEISAKLVQPYDFLYPTPDKCPSCDGTNWTVNAMKSEYINVQTAKIQERPEELPPGQMPHSVKVLLKDDIVDAVDPGDRVALTCLVSAKQVKPTLLDMELQLEGNYIEQIAPGQESMETSEEDLNMIKQLAADPLIFNKITECIAPTIHGHTYVKEAIAETLFGGEPKQVGTTRIRGDIDVLLVGDPGVAKSQMIDRAARLAPRGLLTTGRGSTAAGLTAAVVKDPSGGFSLEAGALVLADKGVCCIDELDKMRDEDRGAIHPAMEQQVVSIAKGGIVATLNARTAVIAAANPALGRYNPYQTLAENINLSIPLLNRFDAIFVIRDEPNAERDAEIADHILAIHENPDQIQPPIPDELLRKYINSAKAIKPRLTKEAIKSLRAFYLKLRAASEDSYIMITARQLESLIRQAEARARARHSALVTDEDAMGVINLMTHVMEQIGIDPATGQPDLDVLLTGKPRGLRQQLEKVLQVIGEMERVSGTVKENDLYDALDTDYGITRSETARLLSVLMKDGTIYMPRPGYYRRTD